ncbi:Sec-independent protein translocase protein TatB [Paracoccus sp. p3-h83]|uniref:Sec-independent protein translocase protein TatB n=1 Tax=Paracoccus sp. p3-h83 TaxID=3342805 RepID=UPI0035BA9C7A
MFDIGWSELLLIGVAALVIIGPEELPRLFHSLGRMTGRARAMAREFSSAMEDAAKSAGLDDVKKDLDGLRNMTSAKNLGLDALDRAADRFEKWEPKIPAKASDKPSPQPDPAMPRPVAPVATPATDEVVTFRTAPAPEPPAAAAPSVASPASAPAQPVRRTGSKTRRAATREASPPRNDE